jgi:hypothetical protein
VADERHVVQVELLDDLDQVVGVAVERVVLAGAVRREVGAARSDVVEEDDLLVVGEVRGHQPPHVLAATETVGEDQRLAGADHCHIVASNDVHARIVLPTSHKQRKRVR